jgi:hypothetical protein
MDLGQFASGMEEHNASTLNGDQFVARLPPAVANGIRWNDQFTISINNYSE